MPHEDICEDSDLDGDFRSVRVLSFTYSVSDFLERILFGDQSIVTHLRCCCSSKGGSLVEKVLCDHLSTIFCTIFSYSASLGLSLLLHLALYLLDGAGM